MAILKARMGYKFVSVVVDDNAPEWVFRYKMSINNSGYVSSAQGLLHRCLKGNPQGLDVAHKNHNKLDCRVDNLEILTRSHNQLKSPEREDNTSGHKGVVYHKGKKRWQAQAMLWGNYVYLGSFQTKEDAIAARLLWEAKNV